MRNLITLEQYEKRFWERNIGPSTTMVKSGIACPECSNELWESVEIASLHPVPQLKLFCRECDWTGRKLYTTGDLAFYGSQAD